MDLFAIDSEEQVYNTEMQKKRKDDLPKRSRYYQSQMDMEMLQAAETMKNCQKVLWCLFVILIHLEKNSIVTHSR